MKRLLVLIPVVALCGCVGMQVPKTEISGTINGKPFVLRSPKNSKLQGLEIVDCSQDLVYGTNFTSIKIQSVEATMNPEVISTTADAQVKQIDAIFNGARSLATKGAAAAAGAP